MRNSPASDWRRSFFSFFFVRFGFGARCLCTWARTRSAPADVKRSTSEKSTSRPTSTPRPVEPPLPYAAVGSRPPGFSSSAVAGIGESAESRPSPGTCATSFGDSPGRPDVM